MTDFNKHDKAAHIYDMWYKCPHLSKEEHQILEDMSPDERIVAFSGQLEFGTSGMRGKLGLGSNRINRFTIRLAAKGLAAMLGEGSSVAIAYDTRENSLEFAEETARVLAAAGIDVYLFSGYSPIPLLSFSVRQMRCTGGVAITASHNTKEYNGFKTYDRTGCQMDSGDTSKLTSHMSRITDKLDIPRSDIDDKHIHYADEEITERFIRAVMGCRAGNVVTCEDAASLGVVYTPLHGTGCAYVSEVLRRAGFANVMLVEEQADYDGSFPTISKPNPEDREALSIAGKYLTDDAAFADGDILIGTDPDCDRIGVGVRRGGGVTYLTGNEVGALLVGFLAETEGICGKTVINTIVTGCLGDKVATANGATVIKTLNGFKNIGKIMNETDLDDFLLAYEDSCGYLVGTHARDKDGVSAALVICRMAAYYKARGKTLADVLDELSERYGRIEERQESFSFEGVDGRERIQAVMTALRRGGTKIFSGIADVTGFTDYAQGIDREMPADILRYVFAGGSWVVIRPSGTEPKLKVYYCVSGEDASLFTKLSQAIHAFC